MVMEPPDGVMPQEYPDDEPDMLDGGGNNLPANAVRQRIEAEIEDEYALPPGALAPMDYSTTEISRGSTDTSQGVIAYSNVVAKVMTDLGISDITSWLLRWQPETKLGKEIVQQFVDQHNVEARSDATQREGRRKLLDVQAKRVLGKMANRHVEEEEADKLITRYSQAYLTITAIRLVRLQHGLEYAKQYRGRHYTAQRKLLLVEEAASQLTAAAYEYYQTQRQLFDIHREISEDAAQGLPTRDYTDIQKRIRERQATDAEIMTDYTWGLAAGIQFAVANASAKNPYWGWVKDILTQVISSVQEHGRGLRNRDKTPGGGGNINA